MAKELDPVVVLPGHYTDPNNPAAASGSVNLTSEQHPLVTGKHLAKDYGANVGPVPVPDSEVVHVSDEPAVPEKAGEWKEAVAEAQSAEELAALKTKY